MTSARLRYRFAEFVVSPARRVLLRDGVEIALIPRYFDLLVLLLERRSEAVSKDEIFDRVWNDVVVSDGALTQAVRILRRSLEDDAREPRFIKTVSRHGYRFVWEDVLVEPDLSAPGPAAATTSGDRSEDLEGAFEALRHANPPTTDDEEETLLEAAEVVLRSGRSDDIERLEGLARALLRDARWGEPENVAVPLWGQPGFLGAAMALIELRVRRWAGVVRERVTGALLGGSGAGALGGLLGALLLMLPPGATARSTVLVALPLVGVAVGGVGALGVGLGLAWAEALVRSRRSIALTLFGAAGGGAVGGLAHLVGRFTVEGLFGRDLSPVGGGIEGLLLGGATGLGFALATRLPGGGIARPKGRARFLAAAVAGLMSSLAGVVLAATGFHLGAMSLDLMAKSFPGSQVSLDSVATLLGPGASLLISAFEGLLFGFGVIWGLTARPRRPSRSGVGGAPPA